MVFLFFHYAGRLDYSAASCYSAMNSCPYGQVVGKPATMLSGCIVSTTFLKEVAVMATAKFNITNGPPKFDLMMAVFDDTGPHPRFVDLHVVQPDVEHDSGYTVRIGVRGFMRKSSRAGRALGEYWDDSGEIVIWGPAGRINGFESTLGVDPSYVAHYNMRARKGTITLTTAPKRKYHGR